MNDEFRNYLDEKLSALPTKEDFKGLSVRLDGFSEDLESLAAATKRGFDRVELRLDRIENLLIRDLVNRVERLENNYRELATAAGK